MLDGTFGYDRTGTTALKIANAKESFTEELCNRLDRVTIENEDGIGIIKRYDSEETFHFVDPPYVGSDCGHYEGTFNEQNFQDLLETLSNVKGKFMLTMFPHPSTDDKPSAKSNSFEFCRGAKEEDRRSIAKYADENGWHIHKIERTFLRLKNQPPQARRMDHHELLTPKSLTFINS